MNTASIRRYRGAAVGIALALVVLLPQRARGQEVLFGVTFDTDQLIRINTTTGAGTAVGTMAFHASAMGISAYQGELYVLDQNNNQLVVVNPNNAATVRTVPVNTDVFSEGDFEIRPSDGQGFYTESNFRFSKLNIQTGAATLVNSNSQVNIDGLAFASSGTLYALQSTGTLFTADPNTGVMTQIGGSGPGGTFGGLDFRSDGVLFGAIDNQLFTLNPANGARTPVGNIGFAAVSGLTFFNVPEPGSAGCLLLGGALFMRRRARRGR